MKKTVISLFLLTLMLSFAFAGGFVNPKVSPKFDPATMFGGDPTRVGRGVLAGTDIDQDGKYEVWVTCYDHRVYCFEQTGNDTLALVWVSAENTADASNPRDIETGDLDNDGKPEIMFFIGEGLSADQPDEGLQIYEWDGTDNGYGAAPAFTVNLFSALNDSIKMCRVENFSVGDIDGDGVQEILIANNGNTLPQLGTKNGSTPYSEDRFIILSITGDIGAAFGVQAVEEYAVSPRDVDRDGVSDNGLGGGSPQEIVICDTDGDGLKEAACFSWNMLSVFFIEATGPDSYTNNLGKQKVSGEPYVWLASQDDWTLRASVADMDGNGKDEVYVVGYYDATLFVITDVDGDATSIDAATEVGIVGTGILHGCTAVPGLNSVFVGHSAGNDVTIFELTGSVLKPSGNTSIMGDWTSTSHSITDATTGDVLKISDAFDSDNDGKWEFVLPYLGIGDINTAGNDYDYNQNRVFRVVEWDETSLEVRDQTIIMPDDYKLDQNYPNPFNPTTTISYTLPIQNNITVNIYNFLGEHVVTLVNSEIQQAGVHDVVWNSLDKNGARVPSGTYFYELKYGNFSQTKRMTLLK